MAKSPSTKTARNGKAGKSLAASVLGTTRDGVHILRSNTGATHFTRKELRDAVTTVRSAKKA
jgi:hypothetical protein